MKFVIIAALAAVAFTAPRRDYDDPAFLAPEVSILKDDRVPTEEGEYNFEFETENGIRVSQAGSPDGNGAIVKAGVYSYTAPDGTLVEVEFVADENGFQPQSDILPVAPEFPHPIPQFVLDQIAFAAEEDARRARGDSREAPSRSNGAPQ
ncbi:cuticle protein AMP1A-like [Palaemon carinicauda]|uniref:cuticle protein AMP1A-like n=1 Tax=Palaemon carinicauda TaxID=392227 RepID=UPI0035B60F82